MRKFYTDGCKLWSILSTGKQTFHVFFTVVILALTESVCLWVVSLQLMPICLPLRLNAYLNMTAMASALQFKLHVLSEVLKKSYFSSSGAPLEKKKPQVPAFCRH